MRKVAAFVLLLLVVVLGHAPAQASGDFGCYPEWTLAHPDFSGCDNMAMLQPGNDTRANLLLLMLDKRGDAPVAAATMPTPDPLMDWATFGQQFQPVLPQDTNATDEDSSYAEGEGSRCRSDADGAAAFLTAISGAADVPQSESAALVEARRNLAPNCTGASGGADRVAKAAQVVQSTMGKNFLGYLQGAQAFYDGDFDTAHARFEELATVNQPWLSETARYMLGRVEVNRAQVGLFDEYGSMVQGKTADPKVIDAAEAALNAYLQAYPAGTYSASARGLLRRVYWLGARTDKLVEAYASTLAEKPEARGAADTAYADEVDNKLLDFTASSTGPADAAEPAFAKDPILLAVFDLERLRCGSESDQDNICRTPFERAWLEGQRASFSADPALFEYLLALYDYYYAHKYADVLQAIPEAIPQQPFTTLEFSRQMLRGMALEDAGDASTRDHWMAMLPMALRPLQRGAVELAIAYHDERTHALDKVFAADSQVSNVQIRDILLSNIADADLLRRQAQNTAAPKAEQRSALYTLLYKELSRGHYADFVKDLATAPTEEPGAAEDSSQDSGGWVPSPAIFTQTKELGDYDCPPLKQTATRLAKNPKDSEPLLCLADFFRANGFDGEALDTQPEGGALGSTATLFKGPVYARLTVYETLIVSGKTPAADKAYALYRAVMCYAPSGNNSCGGKDVEPSQRKAWFMQLKKNHPNARWAKALQYYW